MGMREIPTPFTLYNMRHISHRKTAVIAIISRVIVSVNDFLMSR